MKYHKFINTIQRLTLYNPSIDINTVKTIMTSFKNCLSKRQKEIYGFSIEVILSITSKQITIKDITDKIKTKELEKELNNLKRDKPI